MAYALKPYIYLISLDVLKIVDKLTIPIFLLIIIARHKDQLFFLKGFWFLEVLFVSI